MHWDKGLRHPLAVHNTQYSVLCVLLIVTSPLICALSFSLNLKFQLACPFKFFLSNQDRKLVNGKSWTTH